MKIRITCRGTLEHALKGTNFSGNLLLLIFKGGLLLNHSVKALESDIIHPSNLNLQPLNRPSPFNPHPGGYAAEKQIPISWTDSITGPLLLSRNRGRWIFVSVR